MCDNIYQRNGFRKSDHRERRAQRDRSKGDLIEI